MNTRLVVVPLRVLLVATFVGLLVMQTLSLPGQFAHMASENPDLAYLRWPLVAVSFLGLLCVQVVIVCTWRLLTMVTEDRVFTEAALPWVDAIIAAIGVAWLLLAGLLVYFGFTLGDPGVPMLLMMLMLAAGVLALLMLVMRELLRQATTLRTDMEAVI